MKTILFTDPHLGLNRTSNTTPASRQRLRQALYHKALEVCEMEGDKICLGDLFDTYSNPEEVILQGSTITSKCDLILAGNHDLVARDDKMGSLELISQDSTPAESWVALPKFNEPYWCSRLLNQNLFTVVPHVTTQELFDQSLKGAVIGTKEMAKGKTEVQLTCLLLHCNYECDFAEQETALNLTEEVAEELLKTFDYVFLGHEHVPRDLFGGRLMIIGNTHPTGFSDISDKRIVIIEDGEVTTHRIWDATVGYASVDASKLQGMNMGGLEFLRITGDVDPADMAKISRQVSKIWQNGPSLYGVYLDTNILRGDPSRQEQIGTLETLPAQIERELEGTTMLEFWHEFSQGVKA